MPLSLLLLALLPSPQDDGAARADWDFPEARQFDFWIGDWDVNLRIRQEDLSWADRIRARAKIYGILDGKAILELWDSPNIKGYSLRYFDPAKKKWVLYLNWPGRNRSGSSSLEGAFRHGRGEFFSTSKDQQGKEVMSRYTFSDITPTSLRWDDAFSSDGGKTWSHGWIMEFSRRGDRPELPAPGEKAHTFETGQRCDMEEFRVFESLAGRWHGDVQVLDEDGGWVACEASLDSYKILDGCAVMSFLAYELEGSVHKSFSLKTYNTYASVFEDTRMDDDPTTPVTILYGKRNEDAFELTESDSDRAKQVLQKYRWTFESSDELAITVHRSKDRGITWEKVKAAAFKRLENGH